MMRRHRAAITDDRRRLMPLERWARRDPGHRWPVVFVAIFLAWGLAGWIAGPTGMLP